MSVTHDRPLETRANTPEGRRWWFGRQQAPQQAERPVVSLAERVAAADERVQTLNRSDALFEAPSDDEINAKIAAGEHLRALQLQQQVREGEAEIRAREIEAQR